MSILKRALVIAGATTVATMAVAVSPAFAGVPPTTEGSETATLTITKVVQGAAPEDAEFTILVSCETSGDHELTFGADGGDGEVTFFEADTCNITEPGNGGASSTTGLGEISILEPILYSRTVVNTFDAATSSTSTTEAVAAAAATRPTFTG